MTLFGIKWTPGTDAKTPAEIERFFNSPEINVIKERICDMGRRLWQRDYTEPMGRAVTVFRAFVESWYNGELREIFFAGAQRESIRRAITSVLAGYVIDRKSSLVRNPRGAIAALTQALRSGAPLTDEMSA